MDKPISIDIFNESIEFIKDLEPNTYEKVKYLISMDDNKLYDMGYEVRYACDKQNFHLLCKIEKKYGCCIEQIFCVSYYTENSFLISLKEYKIFGGSIQKCYMLNCIDSFIVSLYNNYNKSFIKLLNYFNINVTDYNLSNIEHEMLASLLDGKNIEVDDFIKLCKDNDINEFTEDSLFYLKLKLEK